VGNQMNEEIIWKEIVGYEGLYEVSNTGLVRTHANKTTYTARHGVRRWKQKVLKEKNPKGRDVRVTLWKEGKYKDYLVHRLVALAFLEQPVGKNCVNHIDGNPKNNNVSNLEWCNHKENNNHAFDTGLIKTARKVILVHKETCEPIYFRSLSKASLYLGFRDNYLAHVLQKGVSEIDEYEIFLKAN